MAEAAAIAARRRYRRSQSEPHPVPLEDDWGDLEQEEDWDLGEDSRQLSRDATARPRRRAGEIRRHEARSTGAATAWSRRRPGT